jgi:hypothetical protein
MKSIWTVVAIMVLAGAPIVTAQASKQVQIDASMLVTGKITISKKGHVAGYQLDHPDKLPKVVVGLLSRYIPRFRFKPTVIHGKAVAGIASMTLRLLARQTGENHYSISVAGYQFGSTNPALLLQEKHIAPPVYPAGRIPYHVGGIVYLFLQINHEGRVMHVYAQQANITQTPRDPHFISRLLMRRWRRVLAHAAVEAAWKWTFKIPKEGPHASQPCWYARIPVNFAYRPTKHHGYGQWASYLPGPRKPIPWLKNKQVARGSIDAQVPGTLYTVNRQLQRTDQAKKS